MSEENNGISKMEFKSLNDAFSNNFIKSLPHLIRLDLTANEKLIKLEKLLDVLHYMALELLVIDMDNKVIMVAFAIGERLCGKENTQVCGIAVLGVKFLKHSRHQSETGLFIALRAVSYGKEK